MSAIPFRPLDETLKINITRSKLPHWFQSGAVHFVTFRLRDSIPTEALDRWFSKRDHWLAGRGLSSKSSGYFSALTPDDRREYRKLFGASFERQLDDCHGSCLLRKPVNARIIAEAMLQASGKRYHLGDFVIMPNHVHVLVVPLAGNSLADITKRWKGFSARQINLAENQTGSLWQRESFDHIVRHRKQLDRLRAYIAENPVKAKLKEGEFILYQPEWEQK